MARAIRCIQIDAVAVAGAPTQLLVPFSRVGPYDPRLLDRLQFEERRLFLYFAHAASLVLTEDFPIFAARMRPYAARTDGPGRRIASWLADNDDLRREVLAAIEARGPLRSRDIENTARTDWRSSGWSEGRSVNRMLDFLQVEGLITVVGRAGNERLWDLSDRFFPSWTPRQVLTDTGRTELAVEHALRALGAATVGQIQRHFTRSRYPGLEAALHRLEARHAIRRVAVRGLAGDWYLHRDCEPLLEAAWQPRTALLSPFDNLIADRARLLHLFGFDYRIEIYVPAARRRRGYYAMPILAGDQLVGTVDPRLDRRSKVLDVSVRLEPGRRQTAAIDRAIAALARFVGALEVRSVP